MGVIKKRLFRAVRGGMMLSNQKKCNKHNTTFLDGNCPECDRELGKGVYEERIIKLAVKAEVAWLKGIEYDDNGIEVNQCSDTEVGWDEIVMMIKVEVDSYFPDEVIILDVEQE